MGPDQMDAILKSSNGENIEWPQLLDKCRKDSENSFGSKDRLSVNRLQVNYIMKKLW